MKKITLVVSILLCAGVLASCSSSRKLAGCWRDQHSQLVILKDDGGLALDGVNGYFTGSWKMVGDDSFYLEYRGGMAETHTIVRLTSQILVIRANGFLEFTWKRDSCPVDGGK